MSNQLRGKRVSKFAQWHISLDAECPECEHCFDVLDLTDYQEIIWGIEICQPDKEIDIFCPECEHEFTTKTIY